MTRDREEIARVIAAIGSYDRKMREEFSHSHDHVRLAGPDNIRRYLPVRELRIRIHPADSFKNRTGPLCGSRVRARRYLRSGPRHPPLPRPRAHMLPGLADHLLRGLVLGGQQRSV